MKNASVNGTVAPGFKLIRDVFTENFSARQELGASVSVVYRGETVVDLWGGHCDAARTRPWQADTVVTVFSATKGMAATCLAMAHSRGQLDFERPVAAYWPEFAQQGKEQISVRQLLAHQAGLSALNAQLDLDLIGDKPRLAVALAEQAPAWTPGTRHGYHAFTMGFYQSELLRRVDPAGRGLGQFFAEEVAAPLGIDFYIGLPDDFPEDQVAPIIGFSKFRYICAQLPNLAPSMLFALMWPWSLVSRTLMNPKMSNPAEWDRPAFRRAEAASAAGLGTARALAAVYGDLAFQGERLKVTPETRAALAEPARPPSEGNNDLIWKRETKYSLGFLKSSALIELPNDQAYGVMGASCADGFADPVHQLGFGFTTNRMSLNCFLEPRRWALVDALYRCLGVPAKATDADAQGRSRR